MPTSNASPPPAISTTATASSDVARLAVLLASARSDVDSLQKKVAATHRRAKRAETLLVTFGVPVATLPTSVSKTRANAGEKTTVPGTEGGVPKKTRSTRDTPGAETNIRTAALPANSPCPNSSSNAAGPFSTAPTLPLATLALLAALEDRAFAAQSTRDEALAKLAAQRSHCRQLMSMLENKEAACWSTGIRSPRLPLSSGPEGDVARLSPILNAAGSKRPREASVNAGEDPRDSKRLRTGNGECKYPSQCQYQGLVTSTDRCTTVSSRSHQSSNWNPSPSDPSASHTLSLPSLHRSNERMSTLSLHGEHDEPREWSQGSGRPPRTASEYVSTLLFQRAHDSSQPPVTASHARPQHPHAMEGTMPSTRTRIRL
ncbi:hypothetical protein K438DRAFT_1945470 [Mycena galopus ATCC 62051]|nr:hypothetical protein K438DRAFT_1945470 [Mycena galopus ATCC 62051]